MLVNKLILLLFAGAALLGMTSLLAKHSSDCETSDDCLHNEKEPSIRRPTSPLRELQKYIDKATQCTLASQTPPHMCPHVPHTQPPVHPAKGELLLHQGDLFKATGDMSGATQAFTEALEVFCHCFSLFAPPCSQNPRNETAIESSDCQLTYLSALVRRAATETRPTILVARALCSLGLVMDEQERVQRAYSCYTAGKDVYQLLFGDACLPAADVSVNMVRDRLRQTD